ncbi:acyltransferase 3, partial [Pseudomonas syringae pv. japonica str. M301072]
GLYTAAMALLLLIAAPMLPHQVIGWQNFLLSLVFIPSENPGGYGLYPTLNVGWTLNYEMFFYLLFSMVFLFQQRHRPLIIAAALFAVSEVLARAGLIAERVGDKLLCGQVRAIQITQCHTVATNVKLANRPQRCQVLMSVEHVDRRVADRCTDRYR